MIFQHKDGELRIYEHGRGNLGGAARTESGVTYYMEILFIDANLSAPISRNQTEERMVLHRGVIDSNAHYVEGGDATRLEPIPLTFSCQAADTKDSQLLIDLLSGVTELLAVGGSTYNLNTRKGLGISIFGLSTNVPAFRDDFKQAYKIEVLYSGTSSWGFRWDEVYLPPSEQTVTESEDALTVSINAQVYGGVTGITSFHADAASGDTVTAIT